MGPHINPMEDRRIERTERTSDSGLGIVLAIILTALIVGGGVFWWKSATRPTPNNDRTNINIEIPNPLDNNNNSGNTQNPSDPNTPPSGGAYNP